MKATLEKVGNLQRRLNISVPADAVATAFDQTFKGIQKQAAIKGFRQGKAPIATIKSIYGDKVKQDVIQDLIQNETTRKLPANEFRLIDAPVYPTPHGDVWGLTAYMLRPLLRRILRPASRKEEESSTSDRS